MSIPSLLRHATLALALAPIAAQAQNAALKTAVWWNPAESGWGLFTFDQGSAVVPVWYSYDADGEPTWFLVPSTAKADGSYEGDVLKFTGVPLAQIAGQAADPHAVFGRATTRFETDKRLVFTYTVGGQTRSKTLTRFDFGDKDLVCRASPDASRAGATNYSDIWWNPSSSGWGLNFQHVGDDLYLTWYTYDTDGEAIFYNGATKRQSDGSFRGDVRRVRNGTPLLQIDGAAATPGSDVIGAVELRFSDGQNGTFAYTLGSVTQSKPITRMQFGDVANTCSVEPYDTVAAPQANECIPEYAIGDLHEYAVTINGAAGTRSETIDGSASFQGQTALVEQVRSDGTLVGRSYIANGSGTVASFGADALQGGTVISTSVNQPLRIERTRFFTVGQRDEQRFTVNTTATVQGASFSTTTSVLDVMRRTGTETVATAAGSFEACKFEFDTEVVEQTTGARVVESGTRWISPAWGIVKVEKTATTTVPVAGSSSQTILWQLTRARHAGESVP